MEHSLHLAAKHFVQSIAPHFSTRGAASGVNSEDDATSGDDDDGGMGDRGKGDDGDSDDNDDESVNNGDSLGIAIAFVKQVSISACY
jgi:hypothetical protein